jgi:hypothetical protein
LVVPNNQWDAVVTLTNCMSIPSTVTGMVTPGIPVGVGVWVGVGVRVGVEVGVEVGVAVGVGVGARNGIELQASADNRSRMPQTIQIFCFFMIAPWDERMMDGFSFYEIRRQAYRTIECGKLQARIS